jgi:hypothetical protein
MRGEERREGDRQRKHGKEVGKGEQRGGKN